MGMEKNASVQSMVFFLSYILFIYSLIVHLVKNNMTWVSPLKLALNPWKGLYNQGSHG